MVGGCLRGRAPEREAPGPGRQASRAAAGPAESRSAGGERGGPRSGASSCAATCGGVERSRADVASPRPPLPAPGASGGDFLEQPPARLPPPPAPPPAEPPPRDACRLLPARATAGTAWEQPVSAPRRPSPKDPSDALVYP